RGWPCLSRGGPAGPESRRTRSRWTCGTRASLHARENLRELVSRKACPRTPALLAAGRGSCHSLHDSLHVAGHAFRGVVSKTLDFREIWGVGLTGFEPATSWSRSQLPRLMRTSRKQQRGATYITGSQLTRGPFR